MGAGAVVGGALSLVGGAVGAYAQYQAGQDNEKIAEWNADIQDARSRDAVRVGIKQEGDYRKHVRQIIGQQRAGYAGQNVIVSNGTAATVAETTAKIGESDALAIRNNAAREAWGYKVNAKDFRMRGKAAKRAAQMGMVTSLLGGGGGALSAAASSPAIAS